MAALTPQQIINRLADIQANITTTIDSQERTIKRAFPRPPYEIRTNEVPCFITFATDVQYDYEQQGEMILIETTTYSMQLYIREASREIKSGVGHDEAVAWYASVRNAFMVRPGLELEAHDGSAALVAFARLQDAVFANAVEYPTGSGKYYAALQITIEVEVYHQINYL